MVYKSCFSLGYSERSSGFCELPPDGGQLHWAWGYGKIVSRGGFMILGCHPELSADIKPRAPDV